MEANLIIRGRVQIRCQTQQLHYYLTLQNQLNEKANHSTEIKEIHLRLLVALLPLMGHNLKIKLARLTAWVQQGTKNM